MKELPIIKLWAIGQGETRQEIGPIKIDGFRQRFETLDTGFIDGVTVLPTSSQGLLKLRNINPPVNIDVQPDTFPIGFQPTANRRTIEFRQASS